MAAFSMFLATPPAATPVASVYREKRAFGPSTSDEPGFSPGLVMEIAESAPVQFRTVRTCCAGWIQVVGVQAGSTADDPNAPLVVALHPIGVNLTLLSLAQRAFFEPPVSFIYTGLDPASLRTKLMPIITETPYFDPSDTPRTPDELWQGFMKGWRIVIESPGFALAEVTAANLSNGFRAFGFAARTNWMKKPDTSTRPRNFLDPVRLFQRLVRDELILHAEAENSWLEVVTKNRVLITLRDEWNAPIAEANINVTDSTTQHTIALIPDDEGTFVGPANMSSYLVSYPGRKLTRTAGAFNRAEPSAEFSTEAPAHHVLSSVRPESWFHGPDPALTDPTKALPLYTEANVVEPLIDGFATFERMVEDLRKVTTPAHFFLFTSWWITHTFELIPGLASSTVKRLFEDINENAAPIRSLVWHFWLGTRDPHGDLGINRAAHNFINGLGYAKSLFDSRTHHAFILVPFILADDDEIRDISGPMGAASIVVQHLEASGALDRPYHMGAHHSKIYIIRRTEGTVAYIGGIDFNPDRLDGPEHAAEKPFHDVHSRIAGPAAIDLARAFVYRWNDHPENRGTDRRITIAPPSGCPPGETCIDPVPVVPGRDSTCMVQIARTAGATTQDYATAGDRNIWATLKQALGRAKKYVYFEEQYFVYPELQTELLNVLPRIDHLIVVMDHYGEKTAWARGQFERARYLFLKPLRDGFKDKVHVFTLVKHGVPYKVHSKVVIIDDVFATLGSANMNRRGFTHDTETNAFILDGRVIGGARKFARDLRVKLWAEHLGWDPRGDTSKLWNIDRAIEIFLKGQTPAARLQLYDYERGKDVTQSPYWDRIIDPEGSDPPGPPPPL
jgi:phosphatidylserine/phosphatidylglycerophosphate/cardiolipin synthase-like enzyme